MFEHFTRHTLNVNGIPIHFVQGGTGFPLLLLHGYPQTHVMWHKIAPSLAQKFTVIAPDLRGYGDSYKPKDAPDHSNYSKRVVAADLVNLMALLGKKEFYLIGHDRGARVAHRLTLDYPKKVKKLGLLDIIPTYDVFHLADQELSTVYYHWFFLIQPYPFPETLIGSNPHYYLEHCLKSWGRDFTAFTPEALAEYHRCFQDPMMIHGTCSDYRAAATIDLEHDQLERDKKIECPLLILWGKQGFLEKKYNVLELWQQRAINVTGKAINCGHFLAEESPVDTEQAIYGFLE
ncbi:alpha/beta hydrolase [Aphanothece hegewaldii CCALA 016]|uniref:Alpha/beta hydrolase n=1 Tax=Aphanothece hegewaldii CCALA 016 TaxID=2107694 RepID=A0A2T1LVY9_9CHRO|nr:alpha/beta hydrolase [Aphanothece hegewaldii]PSF36029.1 alpha/beta hydrolase [Aphanothece hegewaldii CCALA 016]